MLIVTIKFLNKKLLIKKNKGFTLIEIIVIVAILGILASVVLTFLGKAKVQSNDTSVKAALNQARTQADIFYVAYGNYLIFGQ